MSRFGRKKPATPGPMPGGPPGSLAWLNGKTDPLDGLVRNYSYGRSWAEPPRQTILGVTRDPNNGHLYFRRTNPGLAAITIAPPQATKTTGILATQVAAHLGPTVVMSTKTDLAHLTAVVRSRFGAVFHLDSTGRDPVPGMIPSHLSPVALSDTPARAKRIGAMVATCGTAPGTQRDPKAGFWSDLGGELMAAPLYAANKLGYDEEFVLRALRGLPSAADEIVSYLESDPEGDGLLEAWEATQQTHAEGLSSIRMSAVHPLRVFDNPEVRDRRGKFAFRFDDFVRGEPSAGNRLQGEGDSFDRAMAAQGIYPAELGGRYATVFITANSTDVEQTQLIYRMFLRLLWEATSELHRVDNAVGITYRRPTLLVIDELANIAPDPLYPSLVSQSGDQGLIVSSAIQDLGQLEKHFGSEAKSFLTIHGHRLVFPGISNSDTLRAISDMLGTRWENRTTMNDSVTRSDHPSTGFGTSQADHRVPELDPGQIRAGAPGDPKAVLHLDNNPGYEYLWPSPVWGARPWPRILVCALGIQSCEKMIAPDDSEWPVINLPVPDLGRIDPRSGVPILALTHGSEGEGLLGVYKDWKKLYDDSRNGPSVSAA